MLTELELSILNGLKEIEKLMPDVNTTVGEFDDGAKTDIAIEGAKLMRKLQKRFEDDDAPVSEEFFLEFCKATPPVMREMFIFGGLTFLSQMLQS